MSKIEKLKTLARLSANEPKSIFKAVQYLGKYGYVGLRERLYQEVVIEDGLIEEMGDPGSAQGGLKFSFIVPVYNVEVEWLKQAIDSVKRQVYANWELCLVDDCSTDERVYAYLQSIQDPQIKIERLDKNSGISAATNAAAALADGDYLVPLDNDDVVAPNALLEFYLRLSSTQADIIYSDNDVIDEKGNRLALFCKPDYSPDLFLSQMYMGHLIAFRKSLFDEVGGYRSEYDGSQDYDLMLRLLEVSDKVEHVAEVLYSWRALPSSTAGNPDAKPYAQTAGKLALQGHLDRVLGEGKARVDESDNLFVYDVRYIHDSHPLVSIVMPTKDHIDDVRMALTSIFEKTTYPNYEIIILDNNSELPETRECLAQFEEEHENIKVLDAFYGFNWSRLNNQGIEEANGDVFVFLNNDIEVQSPDWLDRLVENAVRPEVGLVGPLLLYPDGTIQHAGVVVGMGGWADHVYKGAPPVHQGNPFVSPLVARNVSAITGACMAVSRATLEAIGPFNEEFVICGSDVEICLRAEQAGLRNVYVPSVRLTHYESKTRDPKDIPEIDFRLSRAMYRRYVAAGDPCYNNNLDYQQCIPTLLSNRERLRRMQDDIGWVDISEIDEISFREEVGGSSDRRRVNLLVPSINTEDVYGGIATAIKFFESLVAESGFDARIIVLGADPREDEVLSRFPDYEIVSMEDDSDASCQVVSVVNRHGRSIPVSSRDWFLATAWWSAYCVQEQFDKAQGAPWCKNPLLYLIQDYEPGFYAWSSRYLLAESTYRSSMPTVAIFNSSELKSFFGCRGYQFEREYAFDPFLNTALRQYLDGLDGHVGKRRQILVYGRPKTDRNAFELVVETLRRWLVLEPNHRQWDIVSAGEQHSPVYLGHGRYLSSVGKLTIEEYAQMLAESYAGISLMVSPHPSYPPLEMAAFGVQVITNGYSGKDLSTFGESVTSLDRATPELLAQALKRISDGFVREAPCGQVRAEYLRDGGEFGFVSDIAAYMKME